MQVVKAVMAVMEARVAQGETVAQGAQVEVPLKSRLWVKPQ